MKKCFLASFALASALVANVASAESAAGNSTGGFTYPTYNAPGVALLDSFYFRFDSSDHHLSSLAVKPESGNITLAFADGNNDDDYYYSVEHKRRSDAGIITGSFVDFGNGNSLYPLTAPPGYTFALRGFRFQYRNGDHHMNTVGILKEAAGVRTYFSDEGVDDPYTVYVDYAWLPTSAMVETTGVITGSDSGNGVGRTVSNASRSIITGFKLDYSSSDHHIREIGVLTKPSTFEMYYGDEGLDDNFTYQVNYAVLR